MIQRQKETGGMNTGGNPNLQPVINADRLPTLADIGISKNLSSRAQAIASIPHDEFEEVLATHREEVTAVSDRTMEALGRRAPVSLYTGNNEWYTPSEYIESARIVMGSIDTDPASSESANKIVKAATYYTKEDDGLKKAWTGNIWMNPPYSQPEIGMFCNALIAKYNFKEVSQAIVLVNNSADTTWFHNLANVSAAFCLTKGRISFYNELLRSAPTNGQAFFYFGNDVSLFASEFSKHGMVVKLIRPYGGEYDL
jgi:phage N-6-adenine-methyltransferase